MIQRKLKHDILALLFASAEPLSEEELVRHSNAKNKIQLRKAIEEVKDEIKELPIQIISSDAKYKLTLRADYVDVVRSLNPDTELTKGALEVLSIIAYKEPVLQSDIIGQLGTGAYDHIRQLLEGKFIVRTPKGRSYQIRLGEEFYRYFEVTSSEAKSIFEPAAQKKLKELQEQKSISEFEKEQYESEEEK
ncbi:MAG: SMC-Scp complex subunit ScpB [Candidatus Woesearchaeota archaeon]